MSNFYVLVKDEYDRAQAFGPYSSLEAISNCNTLANDLQVKDWKVSKIETEDEYPAYFCEQGNWILMLDVLPESYYQPHVWDNALKVNPWY